jgi:hypothetical protein
LTESLGTIQESIHPAEELVKLLEQVDFKYYSSLRTENGFGGIRSKSCCLLTLGDCKVSLMRDVQYPVRGNNVVFSCIKVCYQTGQNMLPVELLRLLHGEGDRRDDGEKVKEADHLFFEELKEALKLRETTSTQLFAALLGLGIPNFFCCETFRVPSDEQKSPILYDAMKLLRWDEAGRDE